MTTLRSLVFMALAFVWTVVASTALSACLALPRRVMQEGARMWARGVMTLLATICGLRFQIRGRENLPNGAVVIAANHQSTWDTLVFHLLFDDPVFVLKKELFHMPLIGWHMWKAGNIGVDRSAGARTLRALVPAVDRALKNGSQVIIFPEGTRVTPGECKPFQSGIAALYIRLEAPVVPVALDSGLFWGRRSVLKRPGVITLEFLPAMPKGLDRTAFINELQDRIGSAADRLIRQAETPTPVLRRASVESAEAGFSADEVEKHNVNIGVDDRTNGA